MCIYEQFLKCFMFVFVCVCERVFCMCYDINRKDASLATVVYFWSISEK